MQPGTDLSRPPVLRMLCVLLVLLAGPALAGAAELDGLVVDPDGRPVPGAAIALSRGGAIVASTLTAADGSFTIRELSGGDYELHAAVPGFWTEPQTVTIAGDGRHTATISLRLSAVSESVVVSASRVELPRSRTAQPVAVLTRDDLRSRQIASLPEALRLLTGLTVTQSGTRGALTSIFPRGAESDSTLVLVDGVRVNDFGGGFDFAHLPLADVERIEVVRGPQSALYGADAIGGVVQIVTRQGGPLRGDASAEWGGAGTARYLAGAAGSAGDWTWGAAADRLSSDGFAGTAPANGEAVSNDDYERTSASGSLAWHRGLETAIRADVRAGTSARGFPGPFGSDPGGTFGGIDRVSRGEVDTRVVALSTRHALTPHARVQAQASHYGTDSVFLSPFGTSEGETRRLTVRAQADLALGSRAGASVGFETQRERARHTFITGGSGNAIPIDRLLAGYFGEIRLDPTDGLQLIAGLRVEHVRRDAVEADGSPFNPRPAFASQNVVSLNPKLSVSYALRPAGSGASATRLFAGAGTGLRPPDAFEIAFTDNPDLRPERSRSVEAGVEHRFGSGLVGVEGTVFFHRFDDLIVAVGRPLQDASRFRTDNISNARSRGVELTGTIRTPFGLDVRAAYTWLDTEILAVDRLGQAPPPFRPGDPLIRRPRHQGSLDLRYSRGRLDAFGLLVGRGEALDVDPSFGAFGGLFTNRGFAVATFGAEVRLTPRLAVFGRVENALDRFYEEALGFPALGRQAIGGIRIAASQ